jgi:YD repeat-containing protein
MTTATYNPLVGKTSETDPSGRTVVSQYDGLNRLQTILDQDGNVIKTFDYKYQILPSTGSSGLVLTGVPGYSSGGPTTGSGTISGPSGYVVTVTMHAAGSPGAPCGLNVMVTGAPSNGPTSVTNATASFTFVMPVSGTVSWFASLVPTGPGGGSFSIQ